MHGGSGAPCLLYISKLKLLHSFKSCVKRGSYGAGLLVYWLLSINTEHLTVLNLMTLHYRAKDGFKSGSNKPKMDGISINRTNLLDFDRHHNTKESYRLAILPIFLKSSILVGKLAELQNVS